MTKIDVNELTNQVIHGDCLDVLAEMPDNSIDTIITDPPYHLGSISKRFTKTSLGDDNDTAANARNGSNQYARLSTGFMGKSWDGGGIAFQPELWAEMLRVAKPGATLLAFGGTRTHHRLMVAIEDAGWEIRDVIMYLFGSGFPKSHNISKAIDRAEGKERVVVGRVHPADKYDGSTRKDGRKFTGNTWNGGKPGQSRLGEITAPATEAAATWEGWGSGGLKPAYEPIILAQAPIEKNYANNAQVWGVAGLNIDGARIGTGQDVPLFSRNTDGPRNRSSYDTGGSKQTGEMATKGRWPSNVLLSHSEGCVRRGEKRIKNRSGIASGPTVSKRVGCNTMRDFTGERGEIPYYADSNGLETVADWICTPDCAVRLLDEQAGVRKSGEIKAGTLYNHDNCVTMGASSGNVKKCYDPSTGSASRFFYTSKAPNREKWFYCQLCAQAYPNKERDDHGHDIPKDQRKHIVAHPTVKPQSILEYLCKLTKTPTAGIVLDPFAGSGTTGLACIETGRDFILIEKESDYYEIAKGRVEAALRKPRQLDLLK